MEGVKRPDSSLSNRPSKISQTFSRFKGIIRIPARKVTPNATQPDYPYKTTTRDSLSAKPYMSQPMLALQRSSMDTDPYPHSQPSDPDSEGYSSPDPSPCSMSADYPLPKKDFEMLDDTSRRSRRLSFHSLSSPRTESVQEDESICICPPTPPPKPQVQTTNYSLPRRPDASSSLADSTTTPVPPPKAPRPLPSLTSKQISPPAAPTPAPSEQAVKHVVTSTSPRLKSPPPPRPVRPLPPVPPQDTTPAKASSPPPASRITETPPPRPLPRRALTVDEDAAPPSAVSIVRSASEATRPAQKKEPPPKLTLPENRRISLLQASGGAAARLSPTIMHRPTPLPILNLPRLPVIQPNEGGGEAQKRSGRARLGDMPALSIMGTHRSDEAEDETEDDDEGDDGDDESDDDDEEEHSGLPRTSTSTESTESGSTSSAGLFGRGSYDLPSAPIQLDRDGNTTVRPELPPLSLASPFDVRFHPDTAGVGASTSTAAGGTTFGMVGVGRSEVTSSSFSAVAAGETDKKGKGREVYLPSPALSLYSSATSPGAGSTTPSTASSMGVEFSKQQQQQLRPSLLVTTSNNSSYHSINSTGFRSDGGTEYFDAHSREGSASDKTPSAQLSDPFDNTNANPNAKAIISPLATPKALAQFEVPKRSDSLAGQRARRANNDSKNASNFNANRNSMAYGRSDSGDGVVVNGLVKRPSMYQRASRSLIDIHEMAKKQEVENIVREEVEEQERVRKRTSVRMSGAFKFNFEASVKLAERECHSSTAMADDRLGVMSEEEEGRQPNRDLEDAASPITRSASRKTTQAILEGGGGVGGPSEGQSTSMPDHSDSHHDHLHSFTEKSGVSDMTGSNLAGPGGMSIMVGGTSTTGDSRSRSSSGSNNKGAGGYRQSGGSVIIMDTAGAGLEGSQKQKQQNRISVAPAYESLHPLSQYSTTGHTGVSHSSTAATAYVRRRRSMPTFSETTTPPPPYPSFAPRPSGHYGMDPSIRILPRDDEGREVLPGYSNDIFLKAIMPLKMEFSAPGVQAKERKWRRVLCVLEGTMLKVYRCPSGPGGVSAIEQWWESKVGAGDVAVTGQLVPPGVSAAKAAAAKKEEVRAREEEKMQHQYVAGYAQEEVRANDRVVASGSSSQVRQPKESPGHQGTQVAITKSALNLAVQFLKPGSRHMRSSSDSTPPSPSMLSTPLPGQRPSLNIPRSVQNGSASTSASTSSTFTSSSRSHSPMTASSSSMTAHPHGHNSRSHSPMPASRPSSRMNAHHPGSASTSSRPPTPSTGGSGRSSSRIKQQAKATKGDLLGTNRLEMLRCYTMQNAESGLGNDYSKRKNVIRVRLEGEQFLLQAQDVPSVVQWIEGLQAASNIALDLDDRPMPRGPIFPRRRRRRRPNVAPILTTDPNAPPRPATVVETYTPTSATAGQPALTRT